MNYTDPTGHWTCGDQYDLACAENWEEEWQYALATLPTRFADAFEGTDSLSEWLLEHSDRAKAGAIVTWSLDRLTRLDGVHDKLAVYDFLTAAGYNIGNGLFIMATSGDIASVGPNLGDYSQGAAFSGVYDPKSGAVVIRPSGNTTFSDGSIPPDRVAQRGGHNVLNQEMEGMGADTSQTVGFVVFYDEPGTVSVHWNSGSVNTPNYGSYAAPNTFRQPVMDAIRDLLNINVISR